MNKVQISVSLLFCCLVCTRVSAAESAIDEMLALSQPEGFGSGFISLEAKGILHGEVESTAVVFGYTIGESRDRTHLQYLAVFDSFNGGLTLTAGPVAIGAAGTQHFSTLSIENAYLLLQGVAWVEEDPLCCGSRKVSLQFRFVNGTLIPIAK